MSYYIDLDTITIDEYREKLKTAYLPPSRKILKENRNERFEQFKQIGIKTVGELLRQLKKRDTFSELHKIDCLSGDYLAILLRELKSLCPKPNKLADFKGITKDTIAKLEKNGIKDTLKLYDHILIPESRKTFAESLDIKESEILELAKLTDLSRLKWVGTTFARMLVDIGMATVEHVANADPVNIHERVNELNREKDIFKGQIGLNDIKILVDIAKEIPIEVQF